MHLGRPSQAPLLPDELWNGHYVCAGMWGEWASVSTVSLFQPTMGLICEFEYPVLVSKYKFTGIALTQPSIKKGTETKADSSCWRCWCLNSSGCKENITLSDMKTDWGWRKSVEKCMTCRWLVDMNIKDSLCTRQPVRYPKRIILEALQWS